MSSDRAPRAGHGHPPPAVLVDATRRRQRPYRSSHPLAIPRTALALDLIRACGALDDDEVVTGGGGYHPLLVARAWTGVWALLSGRDLPEVLPPAGAAVLRAVGWDRDADEPWYQRLCTHRTDETSAAPVRDAVLRLCEALQRHPFLDPGSGISEGPCMRSTRAG